ncbi:MAG: hypothetical protein ACI4D8_03830 [Wujia sp.]
MKKKILTILAAAMLTASLTACGGDDTKVVDKDNTTTSQQNDNPGGDSSDTDNTNLSGYLFTVDGVTIGMDMEAVNLKELLGEPKNYFEAQSCAFNGLDKMYTYDHFEIDTYFDDKTDRVRTIVFLDDMVKTPEGVYIGMTKADMENAYGTDYTVDGSSCIYTKDGMTLVFILNGDTISSIQYNSLKADELLN